MEVGNSCQADVRQYSHERIEDVGSYQRSKRFSVAGAEELGGMLVNDQVSDVIKGQTMRNALT